MRLGSYGIGRTVVARCESPAHQQGTLLQIGTSLFILPNNDQFETKNSQERIVVLNAIARRIVDEQRGKHRDFVFSYKGDRLYNMLNSAWRKARVRAGLPGFRVHDLRIRSGTGCVQRA